MSLCLAIFFATSCSSIPDGRIYGDITEKLAASGFNTISVDVKDGVVTLTGQLPTETGRLSVNTIAKDVKGVKSVQNNVIVVAPTPESTPEPENISDGTPTLDAEAQKISEEFWNKILTKCGDTYYFKIQYLPYSEDYIAFQSEPYISVEGTTHQPKDLTPAEKLNNIDPFPVEWSGEIRLSYSIKRSRRSERIYGGSDGKWSEWSDQEATQTIELSKAKGKWQLNNPKVVLNHRTNIAPVKCSEVDGASPVSTKPTTTRQTNDISDTYAKVGNFIYNKKTMTVFTKPVQFFSDSGIDSFNGLRYDEKSELPSGLKFSDGRRLTEEDYRSLRDKIR